MGHPSPGSDPRFKTAQYHQDNRELTLPEDCQSQQTQLSNRIKSEGSIACPIKYNGKVFRRYICIHARA